MDRTAMSGGDEHTVRFTATADDEGRLDRALARRFPEAGRHRLAELFAAGRVRVDGKKAKKGDRLRAGVEVVLEAPPPGKEDLRVTPDAAAAARLSVLAVDDNLVIVAKPAGMASQPLRAFELGTAANGIAVLHPECIATSDDPRDGGLVHRLDIGTSGALAAARTRQAWLAARQAFGAGEVHKEYLALTFGAPRGDGSDQRLAQRGNHVVVDVMGLPARTEWRVEGELGPWCLVRCIAATGRMHQIRAHLANAGAPIAGDQLYGGPPLEGLEGFFLHAARLKFPGGLDVTAPLPPEREALLARLRDR